MGQLTNAGASSLVPLHCSSHLSSLFVLRLLCCYCSAACCLHSPTDLGIDGIRNFFEGHRCNRYCREEWALPRGRSSGRLPVQEGTLMEEPDHAPTLEDRKQLTQDGYYNKQYQHQSEDDDDYYG